MNTSYKYFFIILFLYVNILFGEEKLTIFFSDSSKTIAIIDSSNSLISVDTSSTKKRKKKNIFSPSIDSLETEKINLSFLIKKKKIDFLDYKLTEDFISYLPFVFLLDLGHTGLPSEINLFGYGLGNSSININGISSNNRWKNNFDLNRIQTEGVTSIHINPLPRGFLYNIENNPTTLSIRVGDTLTEQTISRIRYYQAANNEAFIDAMFSARVLPRLAFLFRATNINTNDRYENTEYSVWKTNLKTTYKISNLFYASLNYYYIRNQINLNGGVNINSSDYTIEKLYNSTLAPVYFGNQNFFSTRYIRTTSHNVQLNLIGKLFAKSLSKINFGYEYNLDEFRQFENSHLTDSTRVFNNNKYKLFSSQAEHTTSFENLYLKFIARYELVKFNIGNISNIENQTNYYISSLLNYSFLNKKIIPSFFGKYLNYDNQIKTGFGLDIITHPFNWVDFYVGFSSFGKPYSLLEKQSLPMSQFANDQLISTFLTSFRLHSSFTKTNFSYFETLHKNAAIPIFTNGIEKFNTSNIIYLFTENIFNKGLNITTENTIWNIQTSANFNYYFNTSSSLPNPPKYSLITGIYYVDTLFNSNLNLKTGFAFYLNSSVDFRVYDYQRGQSAKLYLDNNVAKPFTTIPLNNNSNRLDFILVGRIQNRATFYFTFENILDNKYFVVPFYPMHPRGVRIGLSWDFIN